VKASFKRVEGTRARQFDEGRHADELTTVAPNAEPPVFGAPRSKRSLVVTSQDSYVQSWWVGTVGVGNPPQNFQVLFDTGSSLFWVMDKTCSACSASNHTVYDSSKSSAYSTCSNCIPLHAGYAYGAADGFQGTDEFVLQGSNGSISLAIMGMGVGQANSVGNVGNPVDWPSWVSGVLGLGWLTTAPASPVMWAMKAGVFQPNLFTAYLKSDGSGGQITFGGLDTTNCGAVQGYVPLTVLSNWQFNISMLGIQSTLMQSNAPAYVDTGAWLILGNVTVVDQIAVYVGATWDSTNKWYTIGCNKQYPPVSFVINNVYYYVTYKALTRGYSPTGTGQCIFNINHIPDGMGVQWMLGDPFIQQFCTIFDVDNKRLGFAPAHGM